MSHPINNPVHKIFNTLFKFRWSASILLLLTIDLATWSAFSQSSGMGLFPHMDKVLHAVGFFGLFVLGHVALNFDFLPRAHHRRKLLVLLNWIPWTAYGVFIEIVQGLLAYRSASLGDLAADGLGMLLGTVFVLAGKLYPINKESEHEPR